MNVSRGLLNGMDTTGLNTALAEAICLGLEVDEPGRRLLLDLEVLRLGPDRSLPETTQVRLTFTGVSRVAASLRIQKWDDVDPRVLALTLDGLADAIHSFGGGRLHGWEFIDLDDSGWDLWSELLSFDTLIDQRVSAHVLEFSQEEGIDPRELDVRVWFDNMTIEHIDGRQIPLPNFIADGVRWWRAHDKGDPRMLQPGIPPSL
ncbi:hypothetical protein D5S18_12840 [Nocardia panacis]|uniref:Uncharacterized protein n=1 Tax=Nocardia panacis TaxID=2340916 RepID=A0A3A4KR49_9NOCA|nr:hypothetical protein [Nocardia panacis]RJO77062.1 hypothetical protein D5S18_12840 [Nocardia panacis]